MTRVCLILLLACCLAIPTDASGQDASATAQLLLNVTVAISTSVQQGADFGMIPAGAGAVSLDPQTGITDAGAGVTSAGAFFIAGEMGADVSVTYDSQVQLMNGTSAITYTSAVIGNGADDQTMASTVSSGQTLTLDPTTGEYYFWTGGSIDVGAVPAGGYSGQFTFQVQYISL